VYVDHPEYPVRGHRFDGYYFTYPGEEGHRGVVSTISVDPPMLNWIFVDAATRAVRFGSRKDSLGHVIGPWGWSADEEHLVLHGSSDGFILVRERAQVGNTGNSEGNDESASGLDGSKESSRGERSNGKPPIRWALYWDPDGQLRKRVRRKDWREIRLRRRMKLGMESRYVKADS